MPLSIKKEYFNKKMDNFKKISVILTFLYVKIRYIDMYEFGYSLIKGSFEATINHIIPLESQLRKYLDLNKADFDMYPYMDTMYCIDVENNKAANNDNISGLNEDRIRYCQHTDGTWEGYGEDDSYGERDDDDDDW